MQVAAHYSIFTILKLITIMVTMAEKISAVCDDVRDMLIMKNKAYGDAAANPLRVFSKCATLEQINVRIDDKLSRIARGQSTENVPEDTELDLIGYLILKRVIILSAGSE